MNARKLHEILRIIETEKQNFSSNTKQFFCSCTVLDPDINLKKKMEQKFTFGCLIGYRNSCPVDFLANSKSFRLHQFLHDSATSNTKKGPGYSYFAPLSSRSFLDHVNGLFSRLNVTIIASSALLCSIFNQFNQKIPQKTVNRMSLVVLNIKRFEKNMVN